MFYKVLVVRDRAADCFGQPFFALSVGAAVRAFTDDINGSSESIVSKHPEDFDLFMIGEFNDQNAEFLCHAPKQLLLGRDALLRNSSVERADDGAGFSRADAGRNQLEVNGRG